MTGIGNVTTARVTLETKSHIKPMLPAGDSALKGIVKLDSEPISLGPLLTFNNDTERFPNHEEANKLLTRQYAEGFKLPTLS